MEWIGLHIARYRDLAGMRQEDLAAKLNVSREYVSMIENGHRAVRNRDLLIRIAEALGVSTTDLTGTPRATRDPAERAVHVAVPQIRAALDGALSINGGVISGAKLAADTERAIAARMACDYGTLGTLLPAAIGSAVEIAEQVPANQAVQWTLTRVLFTASMVMRPLGYLDLAIRMADRAKIAAMACERPDALAAADFARAQCLLAGGVQGMRAASWRLAESAARSIEQGGLPGTEKVTWYGLLHLQAALAAATLGRDGDAMGHINEAHDAAARQPADSWMMDFNTANVGVWKVAAILEGGSPDLAPDHARQINPNDLATVQRRSHLLIHTGLGYFARDDHDNAVRAFRAADTLAPAEVRGRSRVREAVGQMMRDARRKAGSEPLRDLAARVGVDPLEG